MGGVIGNVRDRYNMSVRDKFRKNIRLVLSLWRVRGLVLSLR